MHRIPADVTAISFDIWKTLLKGNMAFTRVRLRLIFDSLGFTRIDTEELYLAYKSADMFFNDKAERTGRDFGMADRLNVIFGYVGIAATVPDRQTISTLQVKVGELRRQPQYIPSFIEPDLPQTLQALRDRGYDLGLLSNTGMDNQQVMEPVLKQLGIWHLFKTHLFTSEDGRAKPNRELFHRQADLLGATPNQVLHIGDNINADYRAIEAGMHALVYAPRGSDLPHITSMKQLLH